MGAFRKAAVLLAGAARIPRITFPVRMINGTRVSDLPAAEAKAFAQKAAKKAKSANAEAMFLAQAVRQFRMWTGCEPSSDRWRQLID